MKVLFAGSPAIAVPSLRAVSDMECGGDDVRLAGVLTCPDTPRGRKGVPVPSEVSEAAALLSAERLEKGFPRLDELKFARLGAAAREQVAALDCDLLVCFAFGRLFGPKFLSLFKFGGINIHPSLLPRFRGPSPINAAILARDRETGVSIQTIAPEMDAGLILARETIPLDGRETAFSLGNTAAAKAAEMLGGLLANYTETRAKALPQSGEVSYCSLITKEQGRINWTQSAEEIDARVRAYTPWPLSFTRWKGEELYILEGRVLRGEGQGTRTGALPRADSRAGSVVGIDRVHGILIQTGDGLYAVSRLQRKAKKEMDWKSFLNGARDFAGSRLE